MITRDIEVGLKETSDIRRVRSISDADYVCVLLSSVGVRGGISRVGFWFRIMTVIKQTDVGPTIVTSVGVTFGAE